MNLSPAVLRIWIKGKPLVQGKFCYLNGKPVYIANMTSAKLSINGWGYAIAKQILDAFGKAKVKPRIIYKRADLQQHYITNRHKFQTKGIFRNDGDHQQFWLPLKNWEAHNGLPEEPYKLSVMDVSKWLKSGRQEERVIEDVSIPDDVRLRLRDEAVKLGIVPG